MASITEHEVPWGELFSLMIVPEKALSKFHLARCICFEIPFVDVNGSIAISDPKNRPPILYVKITAPDSVVIFFGWQLKWVEYLQKTIDGSLINRKKECYE